MKPNLNKTADLYNTESPDPVGQWGTIGQLPATDTTRDQGTALADQVQRVPGQGPSSPIDAVQRLKAQGYWQCPGKLSSGQPCDFWLDPARKLQIEQSNGYFTCPKCHHTFDLMDELPTHGLAEYPEGFGEGGQTRIGIPLTDQGQIGENVVAGLGTIPGYGPITWWHPGGAGANSPLDGATKEWGIEVKTLSMDSLHHRFSPGGESGPKTIQDKNAMAKEMGLKGVLGILVMLDYRRDKADVYVKEMPLAGWEWQKGRRTFGVGQFRKNTAQRLVAEVPFKNPYKDPNNPSPQRYDANEYYDSPDPAMPPQLQQPESDPIPF